MSTKEQRAAELLREFKGDTYTFGLDCFDALGPAAASCGARAAVVVSGCGKPWGPPLHEAVRAALDASGVALAGELIPGPKPNAPVADVLRIADALAGLHPDVVVAVGGGSCIDAAKAALAYSVLADVAADLHDYFGVGQVTTILEGADRKMVPLVAVQLASGSAAHLTKYSNVTNTESMQKMLIVDAAVVPPKAVFDYAKSATMSADFTMDGALDGVAHCVEVLYGSGADVIGKVRPVSLLGIDLIVSNVKAACRDPEDVHAREALGLGTDLGGYAIMIGGTNGAHLTSFSLVDLLPHGRACALMNPYYTVLFAPAITDKLRAVGAIYKAAGYTGVDLDRLSGRELGLAVAEAMLALAREIGFPTTLGEVEGFSDGHIGKAIEAAKNPKLESKLRNMPVPLSADDVDTYMEPVLRAAQSGDFSLIRNVT